VRNRIEQNINQLIEEIKIPEVKQNVYDFFVNDVLNYIDGVNKIVTESSSKNEYSLELEKKLETLNNQILLKGKKLEEEIKNNNIIEKVKDKFRELVGDFAYKGEIVKYAYEKPKGFPGDYKIIEIIYNNKQLSQGFGRYCDEYFLKSPYAVAVRYRKDKLKEILKDYILNSNLNEIKILNLACGSCREIRELLEILDTKKYIYFTLIDWDEEALGFSKDELLKFNKNNIVFNFVKEDILHLIKKDLTNFQKQDFIYSIGLIDYLPDKILKRLIYVIFQLLNEKGKIVLTHKNREKTFPPLAPDWFCDWKFVPRNKDEVINLFYSCDIKNFKIDVTSDEFEYIYYFNIVKE